MHALQDDTASVGGASSDGGDSSHASSLCSMFSHLQHDADDAEYVIVIEFGFSF